MRADGSVGERERGQGGAGRGGGKSAGHCLVTVRACMYVWLLVQLFVVSLSCTCFVCMCALGKTGVLAPGFGAGARCEGHARLACWRPCVHLFCNLSCNPARPAHLNTAHGIVMCRQACCCAPPPPTQTPPPLLGTCATSSAPLDSTTSPARSPRCRRGARCTRRSMVPQAAGRAGDKQRGGGGREGGVQGGAQGSWR